MSGQFSFPKKEHLCKASEFSELFEKGQSIYTGMLKVVWLESTMDQARVSVAVSVSKRSFKHAVDRNIIKRRLREAYRKHKSTIISCLEQHNTSISLIFIYTRKEIKAYSEIEENVIHSLLKLENEVRRRKQSIENTNLAN